MMVSRKLRVELTRSLFEGPGEPQALCGQQGGGGAALCIGVGKCSCEPPRVQASIQRLLESIASRLTLPKLHLATCKM